MTLHTPKIGYVLSSVLADHPPCGVVKVDGECDERAVAVHLRLHRGLHPAHGHGSGRRFGRRQENGVGLCGFKDLSDDRFSINSAILWPLSNFLYCIFLWVQNYLFLDTASSQSWWTAFWKAATSLELSPKQKDTANGFWHDQLLQNADLW